MLTLSVALRITLEEESRYSSEEIEKIIKVFSRYHAKDWIYPGAIKRQLKFKIEDVYHILNALEKTGVIEGWYELCCGHCQRVLGTVKRFNELPPEFTCELCDTTLNTMENTIKIYKVLQDG